MQNLLEQLTVSHQQSKHGGNKWQLTRHTPLRRAHAPFPQDTWRARMRGRMAHAFGPLSANGNAINNVGPATAELPLNSNGKNSV